MTDYPPRGPERSNSFLGAATETDPPEATFDLEPATRASRPVGLESLLCALAVLAWVCLPAVAWAAYRWAF